jgi:phenylacetic acid degradation operon negative regulatory protein
VDVQPNTVEASLERDAQPRSLAISLFWIFARNSGDALQVSAIIRLMESLRIDEQSVRSTISRLKRRGILVPQAHLGQAGYALSEYGRELLRESDDRNFDRRRATLADGWITAVFGVPESERSKRHLLRSRLRWLGFGTVSAGVWIAPSTLLTESQETIRRHDLGNYVDLFTGPHHGPQSTLSRVGAWWDLAEVDATYRDYIATMDPLLARAEAGASSDAECFSDFVRALTSWRRLPVVDPGIPHDLLPTEWHADQAAALVARIGSLLAEPAKRHVAWMTSLAAS